LELVDIRREYGVYIKFLVDETRSNETVWSGMIQPLNHPYNDGAFSFCVLYKDTFPTSAPQFRMNTPI
jgi:ubiquitin-protein ligase